MAGQRVGVFFPYFGGKYMRAPHYPEPRYTHILEPFAGAAGYSVRHYWHKVTLMDTSPYVAGVWRYLIRTSAAEIERLPLMEPGQDVRTLPIPQEAQWLLGFWFNQGSGVPKRTMGGRLSNEKFGTWGPEPRARLASQVDLIRHWDFIEGDYRTAPEVEATWFIDPPYEKHGDHYPHRIQDREALAQWCRSRKGQTIVCETEGATWLPFKPITTVAGATHRITQEVAWMNDT